MQNNNNLKIAVFPVAGMGTRFLPQTKAMPKEMLPIINKPVIQLVVEDLVAAGVEDIIIVTGSTKRAIEDHFDRSLELEEELRKKPTMIFSWQFSFSGLSTVDFDADVLRD